MTVIKINAEDQTRYVASMDTETREQIRNLLILAELDNEDIDRAMDSRVCDLEDTIDIYYMK